MIVNPQLFNYRLIIGSLIVALAVLTVFSFTSYQSISSHQQFLEQEKLLVQSELSEMLHQYDEVSAKSESVAKELEAARETAQIALDSLKVLKSNVEILSKYKIQLQHIKDQNKILFHKVDSINEVNKELHNQRLLALNELKEQQKAYENLSEKNQFLNKTLEKGALLTANSFRAEAYSLKLGKKLATDKAKKARNIEVCFTLAENALASKGFKEIYIQILDPKNNVMADKGAINFGQSSLIYSLKQMINYQNSVTDVCVDVKSQSSDQPLLPGLYNISIFHKSRRLGSTQIRLY